MGFAECVPIVAFIGYGAVLFAPSRSESYEMMDTIQFLSGPNFSLDIRNLIEYTVKKQKWHPIGMVNLKRIKTILINPIALPTPK